MFSPEEPTPETAELQQVTVPPVPEGGFPDRLPLLPLRESIVFPTTVAPLSVNRSASLKMLDEALPEARFIGLIAQRNPETEHPGPDDLYAVGCAAVILKLARQADNSVALLVHGVRRFRISKLVQAKPYLVAEVTPLEEVTRHDKRMEAAFRSLRDTAKRWIEMAPEIPNEAAGVLGSLEEPGQLADFLAANLDLDLENRQDLLEEPDVAKRVRRVQVLVSRQLEIAKLQAKIQQDVQTTFTDAQRKIYLREQLKVIQKELGEEDPSQQQIRELREALQKAAPPPDVMEEAEREMRRLDGMHPANPEWAMTISYIETIAELPWNVLSDDQTDLAKARKVLDHDHYDLDKVKKRLIEFLAVRKLNPQNQGPILCLVGPPGVGKTSLGKSVAAALGRQFIRISLGGIRDEAEIRGHRRTYIGSMPGRLIQELRRAGTRNPVIVLDEIDKIGSDFRGDPASALLEVLDPRQNHAFVDRYLDVPFDLSRVLFLATANYMDPVPHALRDRMEILEIPGYTDTQKTHIAKRYLVKRQMSENGLKARDIRFEASGIKHLIDAYTREAGVRDLERQIASVCRGVAAQVAEKKGRRAVKVDARRVEELLGPPRFQRELASTKAVPGVVTGLAYTPVGGEVLFVEATGYPGKGLLQLTGQMGDVMKESVTAALSLVRSRCDDLGIDPRRLAESDLHVHVPAGAVPKDGPSAGVAMYTAIASLFSGKAVRPDLAMTGEITLRGLVLPIGGLKEKTLAALRAGIRTVILPAANRKDLPDLAPEALKKLEFIFVENVDELLENALARGKSPAKRK